jgi:hypothetical protein
MQGFAAYNAPFSRIHFFAGALANACSSAHSLKGRQTDFHWRMNASHSFVFLVVHSPMHAVLKQALIRYLRGGYVVCMYIYLLQLSSLRGLDPNCVQMCANGFDH